MDWFKGIITEKHHISWEHLCFPIVFLKAIHQIQPYLPFFWCGQSDSPLRSSKSCRALHPSSVPRGTSASCQCGSWPFKRWRIWIGSMIFFFWHGGFHTWGFPQNVVQTPPKWDIYQTLFFVSWNGGFSMVFIHGGTPKGLADHGLSWTILLRFSEMGGFH